MAHKFSGLTVREILRLKKGSIRLAPLPEGSPSWHSIEQMTWEEIDEQARMSATGFRTLRKLLSDQRFDR